MQPQDVTRVLSDPMAQELMQSSIPARLAYLGPDGFPRAIPIGFHWNGTQFVLCTAPHAPTVSALKTNPKVAFTVDTNAFPPHVLLVRGTHAFRGGPSIPVDWADCGEAYRPCESGESGGRPPNHLPATGKLSLKDWSFADCIDRLLPALEEFVRHADSAKLPATVGQEVQSLRMVTTNAPVMQILPGLPCPRHLAPSHAAVREDQPGAPGYNRPREGAVMQIRLSPDLREMIAIVKSPKTDLDARIPHGDGQTILREAILIVDHSSYHVGEFAILRPA
jgi:Pyridoxamine 5'-phosphate oxidase